MKKRVFGGCVGALCLTTASGHMWMARRARAQCDMNLAIIQGMRRVIRDPVPVDYALLERLEKEQRDYALKWHPWPAAPHVDWDTVLWGEGGIGDKVIHFDQH